MTKLVSLGCNECGAPLEVPQGTKHLTCMHCDTRLVVEHTGSAYYTILEKLEQTNERLAKLERQASRRRRRPRWRFGARTPQLEQAEQLLAPLGGVGGKTGAIFAVVLSVGLITVGFSALGSSIAGVAVIASGIVIATITLIATKKRRRLRRRRR